MPFVTPQRFITAMGKSRDMIRLTVQDLTQAQATTARDGDDGWNVVEVMCHLRDFEKIFWERAQAIDETDNPTLKGYDHEQLALLNDYANQQIDDVLADFLKTRQHFLFWLAERPDTAWDRVGTHPENGEITLLGQAVQVATHDMDHLEQIIRILKPSARR